jgi:hypothetical protein
MSRKKNPKTRPGPGAGMRVKINEDWRSAIGRALKKGTPTKPPTPRKPA